MFSTDRYRLLKVDLAESFQEIDYSIPTSFVDILLKYKKYIKTVMYSPEEMLVQFSDGSTISSLWIKGEYKDLSPYFPTTEEFIVLSFEESLYDVVARHDKFSKSTISIDRKTTFCTEGNSCNVMTKLQELGVLAEDLMLKSSKYVEDSVFSIDVSKVIELFKTLSKFKYFKTQGLFLFEDDNKSFLMKTLLED